MLSTVIEINDSTINFKDKEVNYLSESDPVVLNFIQKYPEILKNEFILLKPNEFNLYNSLDFENIN